MRKKFISMIIAICLALSMIPVSVLGVGAAENSDKKTPTADDFDVYVQNGMYDGKGRAAVVTPKQGIEGMGEITVKYFCDENLLESAPEDAGIYTVKIDVAEGTEYEAISELTDEKWSFFISARPIDVIGAEVSDKTFDGTTSAAVSWNSIDGIVSGDDVKLSYIAEFSDANVGIDKGVSIEFSISGKDSKNYIVPENISSFASITTAQVTLSNVKASEITSGQALSESSITGSATFNGKDVKGTFSFKNASIVPCTDDSNTTEYTVIFIPDESEVNFKITETTVTLKVKAPLIKIVVTAADKTKVYDGTPLEDKSFTYTQGALLEGDVLNVTIESRITDVGSVPNTIKSYEVLRNGETVTGEYAIETVDGTLTVTKRDITFTSASAEKKYDGSALTDNNVTVGGDGFAGEEGAEFTATGSQKDVGSSDNTFTYTFKNGAKAENYNVTTSYGKLTVTINEEIEFVSCVQKTLETLNELNRADNGYYSEKVLNEAIEAVKNCKYDSSKSLEENQAAVEAIKNDAINKIVDYNAYINGCPFLRICSKVIAFLSEAIDALQPLTIFLDDLIVGILK